MHHPSLLCDDTDHPRANLHSPAGRLILIAPACHHLQRLLSGLEQKNVRVVELEQLVHRPKGNVTDLLEVERRIDVGRHALQDLDLGRLAGELRRRSREDFGIRHRLRVAGKRAGGRRRCRRLMRRGGSDIGRRGAPRGVRQLLHREHMIDVGGTELEDAGHTRHRGDRLDLHVHRVEDWPLRLGPPKFKLQHPVGVPGQVRQADVRARVLANIPDRLAEELERERDVRFIHVVDLGDDGGVRLAVSRARYHHSWDAVLSTGWISTGRRVKRISALHGRD